MKIRRLLYCLSAMCVLAPLLLAGTGTDSDRNRPERVMLNLTADPSTGIAVSWQTPWYVEHPTVQVLAAPDNPDFDDQAVTVPARSETVELVNGTVSYHHSAILSGLEPETRYTYRVGGPAGWSEWNDFQTATSGFEAFSFVYLGDPQKDIRSRCSRVFRSAFSHAPDAAFWLLSGDLVNKGDDDGIWGELFDAMGWISRTIPIVAVPGNHEYYLGDWEDESDDMLTPLWRSHFAQPENGPAELEESCFTFVYQDVRFIMLNGNEKWHEQAAWMEDILKTSTARWTIVSMHQPCYPAIAERDIPELREIFVPIYDRYHVDLVLQGHDHTYARTFPLKGGKRVGEGEQGTVYTISVSGPKMYEPAEGSNPIMARTGSHTQLYQVIHVSENKLLYESFTVTGKPFDRFELTRDSAQTKGATATTP